MLNLQAIIRRHFTKQNVGRQAYKPKIERGFTLVEMVVVVTLFSMTVVAVADIFTRTQRAQRKASALEKLQADARFIMNKMTSDIRNGAIDYSYYTDSGIAIDPANGNSVLALASATGERFRYFISNETRDCDDEKNTPCVALQQGAVTERLTSEGVKSDRLKFFIFPATDPFVPNANGDYSSNQQPRAMIVLGATSKIKGLPDPAAISIQTTAVTREYKR